MNEVGKGGSCVVYKVLSSENEILALKCVNLKGLPQSMLKDYIKEVKLLKQLRGQPGIIDLIDYEINSQTKELLIVRGDDMCSMISSFLVDGVRRNGFEAIYRPTEKAGGDDGHELYAIALATNASVCQYNPSSEYYSQ